ncbi:MAG: magnesium-translocating P-type ATPase [Candidatus Paceibacterota bacterium]|jgi:Mg2+-importing ATPase
MLNGLTQIEVKEKLRLYGPNVLVSKKPYSPLATFLKEFKNPLVLLLLVASIISLISGSYISALIIIIIIILSSVINFFISHKSQKATELLLRKVSLQTIVVRDGSEQKVLATEIVVGDIIVVEAGNVIPADGIIKEGHDLFVNESSLTGESLPIEKNVGDSIYLGSSIVTGHVYVEVTATGKNTKFASIVSLLQERERTGEFEKGIKDFSILITKVVIIMVVVVFLANALLKHDILQSLIFALAIAVGVTPELLPMIIAFNVSKSATKMAKGGVIIKKLSAIENFGSMDILCTDKTGTLTEDKITVVKYLNLNGENSLDVLKYAYIGSFFHTGTKQPLDRAITSYRDFDISLYKKIDEMPFDFERKRDSIVFQFNDENILVVKGAPEQIFPVSNLSKEEIEKAKSLFEDLSKDGYRVLAIASKILKKEIDYTVTDETNLKFEGLIAFIDPPKKGVKEVLDELETLGINIKIITGDHLLVTEKIAKEVGLPIRGMLNGEEIENLSDADLADKALKTNIFARVTPVQKNRIIKALQMGGHVVGYMGDGINDAPSLHTADVGISVDNAVDVAKESADIILLNKDFRQLINGVTEGRKTFANTNKYISMAISSNFGNMFSMTGASIILPFLPMLPVQILFNNLLYEVSQFSLTFDNVDREVLARPNPWNIKFIKNFMFVFGGISSVFDFLTFFILYKIFMLSGAMFQTGWFIESFATQTLVIFLIRSRKSIFKSISPHPVVIWTTIGSVIVAWSVALTFIGKLFDFVALSIPTVLAIVGIVVLYLIIVDIAKGIFYKKFFNK